MIERPEGGSPARSPSLALFLSFLWPGLGQLYQGRRRAALLYGLPVLVVAAVLLVEIAGGFESFAATLLDASTALTLAILIALLGVWRLLSMGDAVLARRGQLRPSIILPIGAVLAVLVVASHVWLGSVSLAIYDADQQIFVGDQNVDSSPAVADGSSPNPSDNAADFQATPFPTPSSLTKPSNRITVLVTGIDSGHGRDHALTDTLLLVSVDPDTDKVAMLSFPRDISDFPLYNGGKYAGKINSLMTYARLHPTQFPDGGLPTLAEEIGYLAGIPVQYFAAINLDGFRNAIDLVGGVDVVNPKPINDPMYDWLDGTRGFQLAAGPVHLDGRVGLAYVRSRYGIGDNDFTRAARQQQVLAALRKKLVTPAAIAHLPELVRALGSSIRTNYPVANVSRLLAIASKVTDDNTFRKVLGPPYAVHPPSNTTGGIYTLVLDMTRLEKLSVDLFGLDSRYAVASAPAPSASAAP